LTCGGDVAMTAAWLATRLDHFAAVMAAFGIGAFRLYAFAGSSAALADALTRAALDTMLIRLTSIASVVALLSALGIIPFMAAEMTGSNALAFDPATWHAVLLDTEFGTVWCWHLGFAVALVGLTAGMPRRSLS
jgi:putative copper export protein